jgi:hypothetical protein
MITNYLSPLEFQVTVKKLPNVEFFVQKFDIPSLSMSPPEVANPFNKLYQGADKITYSEINLSFIIDEKMENYKEVMDWMISITAPQSFDQYRGPSKNKEDMFSDVSVLILNSNKNANIRFDFTNCFPISLSSVALDTTQQDIIYPEASVTFQYDYFTMEVIR